MTNQDFLKANNLDFVVEKVQNRAGNVLVDSYSTMTGNTFLGTVGSVYQILQPEEQLDIMTQLAGHFDFELDYGVSFKDNKKVMMYMKCPNIKIADDTLHDFIISGNSFDKSTSAFFTFGNTTIRCQNQFTKHFKNRNFSIRHSSNMNQMLKEMISTINVLNDNKKIHYNVLERFVSTKITLDLAHSYVNRVLDIEEMSSADYENQYSTRKKNIKDAFMTEVESEMGVLGKNAYGLFNGATKFCTFNIEPLSNNAITYTNNMFNFITELV